MLLEIGTIDGESGRMADVAGSVRSYARILARMPRGYGFDAEGAHVLVYLRDYDIRIARLNSFTVKLPYDRNWKVAFHYGTRRRNHVTPIRRPVTDRERPYMRHNYNIMITND